MKTIAAILALSLTGCLHPNKPLAIVNPGPTKLQQRAADFLDQAKDQVVLYRKDWKAAQYEQPEIDKVQADIDKFDLSVPDTQLWIEIDQLIADLEAMAGRDAQVYESYVL